MDKEKTLLRLSTQVDTLKAHINRLKKEGYEIHSMDMDVLRKNILQLYEMLVELSDISKSRDEHEIIKETDHNTTNNLPAENEPNDIGSVDLINDKQEGIVASDTVENEGEELSHSAVEESDQIIEEKVEEPSVDKSSADDTPIQDELKNEDRIAFSYVNNPNGSMNNIAGILSKNRRVLGMMPHPERNFRSDQNSWHPKKLGRIWSLV